MRSSCVTVPISASRSESALRLECASSIALATSRRASVTAASEMAASTRRITAARSSCEPRPDRRWPRGRRSRSRPRERAILARVGIVDRACRPGAGGRRGDGLAPHVFGNRDGGRCLGVEADQYGAMAQRFRQVVAGGRDQVRHGETGGELARECIEAAKLALRAALRSPLEPRHIVAGHERDDQEHREIGDVLGVADLEAVERRINK